MHPDAAPLDPRIGILQRATGLVFYAYTHGYDKEPTTGTREQVEIALGIRPAPARKAPREVGPWRDYLVTVTPAYLTYAGSLTFGESVETVTARSAAEAISRARRARREENGRYAVPARFRARLA